MGYIGVYWGYNLLTNHLLTSWDIQVVVVVVVVVVVDKMQPAVENGYPSFE